MAGAVIGGVPVPPPGVPPALKRCWWVIAAASAPLAVVMLVFERGQISWLAKPSAAVLATTITSMSSGWLGLEVVLVLAAVAWRAWHRQPRDRMIAVGAGQRLRLCPPWSCGRSPRSHRCSSTAT